MLIRRIVDPEKFLKPSLYLSHNPRTMSEEIGPVLRRFVIRTAGEEWVVNAASPPPAVARALSEREPQSIGVLVEIYPESGTYTWGGEEISKDNPVYISGEKAAELAGLSVE